MITLPEIVERMAEPFVAVRMLVTMADLSRTVPAYIETLHRQLAEHAIAPAGPLFFRYNVIDMADLLEIDIGVAVLEALPATDGLVTGTLPAGRYARLTYFGPYENLYDVNALMIGWAKERAIAFDVVPTERGDAFGCRLEIYHTDMMAEPDPAKWETELAIRLADPR